MSYSVNRYIDQALITTINKVTTEKNGDEISHNIKMSDWLMYIFNIYILGTQIKIDGEGGLVCCP